MSLHLTLVLSGKNLKIVVEDTLSSAWVSAGGSVRTRVSTGAADVSTVGLSIFLIRALQQIGLDYIPHSTFLRYPSMSLTVYGTSMSFMPSF
ncbi:surface protein [Frog virus 3]|uniref:Surface protein n=1 Tax=Frog virus 3 TaxID=10493 RepID=A0A5B8P1U2_FRG3V|nr:surface protein [Frog virus 3]